jgi:hypothetical protein
MEKKLYDDAFYVEEKRYGLWSSTDKEGNGIITSLTEEDCVRSTRWYLKAKQEGEFDKISEKTYNSIIEGKL